MHDWPGEGSAKGTHQQTTPAVHLKGLAGEAGTLLLMVVMLSAARKAAHMTAPRRGCRSRSAGA